MRITFVTQPYVDDLALLDFLDQVVEDEGLERIDVVVAWAKSSALEDLRSVVTRFADRGGTLRCVVGISLGGTSKQALATLLELFDEVYVFHSPGRTFHPKVYLASGASHARLLLGSHNLTGGGIQSNFEAGVIVDIDLERSEDRDFYASLATYIDRLLSDRDACKNLDGLLLSELIQNPRYPLADENQESPGAEPVETEPDARDTQMEAPAEIFGGSRFDLRRRVPIRSQQQTSSAGGRSMQDPFDQPEERDPVVRRWFKRLPAADAQQLRGSHPSGTMTLTQSGHNILAGSYFREEMFGDVVWTTAETRGTAQPREVAQVEAAVYLQGRRLGPYIFEIRHTPGYAADQANRTTEFVWGEFARYLRESDTTGMFATIEKLGSGRFRLTIADEPTGDFRY